MRRLFVALTLLLVLLIPGCVNPLQPQPFYIPSGTVYGPDGQGMAGVTITFNDGEVTKTDRDGRFEESAIQWRSTAKASLEGMDFSPDTAYFRYDQQVQEFHGTNAKGSKPSFSVADTYLNYTYLDGRYSFKWELQIKNEGNGFGNYKILIDRWDTENGPPTQEPITVDKGLPPGATATYTGELKDFNAMIYKCVFIVQDPVGKELFRSTVYPQ